MRGVCQGGFPCATVSVILTRPEPTEYAEFYRNYIAKVPDGPPLDFLARCPGSRAVRNPGLRGNPPIVCHPARSVRVFSTRILPGSPTSAGFRSLGWLCGWAEAERRDLLSVL